MWGAAGLVERSFVGVLTTFRALSQLIAWGATGFRSLPNEFIFSSLFFNTPHCEQFHLETFFPSNIIIRQTKNRNKISELSWGHINCLFAGMSTSNAFYCFYYYYYSLLFSFEFFWSLTRTRRCLKPWLSLWVICFFPVLAEFELIWFLCFGRQKRTRKQRVSTPQIQLTKAIKKWRKNKWDLIINWTRVKVSLRQVIYIQRHRNIWIST